MNELQTIMQNLKSGMIYGTSKEGEICPYFDMVLSYRCFDRGARICWHHYGRSTHKATLSELKWIIKTIFNMTPTAFINTYECVSLTDIEKRYLS